MKMLLYIFYILFIFQSVSSVDHPSHNKPFGTGYVDDVESIEGFMDPIQFFMDYILNSKPILFKNAAKSFPAYQKWDDDYFLNMNLSGFSKTTISAEQKKKENRTIPMVEMEFKDFIRMYNRSDIYMVDVLPKFLEPDVTVPWSLQCDFWLNAVHQVMTWFSSGGTSSVVHTDDMDNVNCVLRGHKTFLLVNPHEHGHKIPLHKEGSYSDIDVDRVDFSLYPEMATVEFLRVDMGPGDCLFVPRLWIHQVRSWNRSLAINIWFDRIQAEQQHLAMDTATLTDRCQAENDPTTNFATVKFLGIEHGAYRYATEFLLKKLVGNDMEGLYRLMVEMYPELSNFDSRYIQHVKDVLRDVIIEIDKSGNGVIEQDELLFRNDEIFDRIMSYMSYVRVYINSLIAGLHHSDHSRSYHAPQSYGHKEL